MVQDMNNIDKTWKATKVPIPNKASFKTTVSSYLLSIFSCCGRVAENKWYKLHFIVLTMEYLFQDTC